MDIHAGNSCKVEGLEGHLGPWLSDALSPHRAHRGSWLDPSPHELVDARGEELLHLSPGQPLDLVENWERERGGRGRVGVCASFLLNCPN